MTAVFVDRTESLNALASVADALADGRSSVLVIEGESGMGKSTLLREFVERTTDAGTTSCRVVLVCSTPGIGTHRPYGPILDALHELQRRSSKPMRRSSWWGRALGRGAMAAAPDLLSAAVPGLGMLFAAGREFTDAAVSTGSIPGDSLLPVQTTVTQQVIEVLLEQARADDPLLLIIDDLQLCDVTTLELLHLLLPRLAGEPLGLVLGVSSYTSTLGNGPAVKTLLEAWRGSHRELMSGHMLPPLPDWAVRQLVDARLHGQGVPADFALQLAHATAGRPIFVEQCLQLWQPAYGARVPLPRDLPAAVDDRIDLLDDRCRELLVIGATMGEFFFSHTVAEVAGVPHSQVQDLLRRVAHEHGLIRERCEGLPAWAGCLNTDWYDFEHRILQHGIRGRQSQGARLGRHARLAEALRQLPHAPSERAPRELRALIADQLCQAGPACAGQSSAAHYELARSVAVDDLSFAQAEQHCRTAIESARLLPQETPERDLRLVEAVELLLCLTEVRWKGVESEQNSGGIDTLAAEAEQAAHRLGDRLLIARTTLQRGKTLMAVQGLRPSLAKLEEAVQHARGCEGAGGAAALFVAMVEYGRQLPKRDLQAGLRVLIEAEEFYASDPSLEEAGNPVLQHARNLNEMQIGVNLFDAGHLGEARRRLLRCTDRLRGERLRAELPIALNYLSQLHLAMGAYEDAETVLREALEFEERRGGDSGWHAYNSALLALRATHDPARRDEAAQRIRDAWHETERTRLASLMPIVRNLYIEVLLRLREDPELARRLADDTLAETRETGMVRSEIAGYCLRGRIRLATGDTDLAVRDVRHALTLLAEHGDLPALRTEEVLYDAATALTASGNGSEATQLLDRARREVLRKAEGIGDMELRTRFLNAVPLNRELFGYEGEGEGGTE
ncbi:AAA family ATPase [Streptomyces atratus]|uniref:AAA family ATPase n=1 Tax=Streptomyces atratus TaxID=1893 RepID=UPI0033E0215B